mgnify:CR=1 FL=1
MSSASAFEVAHAVGAVPIAVLVALRVRGVRRASAWWILAAAFAVSFVADSLAHWVSPPLISQVYPVTQAGLFALVLAPASVAVPVIGLTIAAAGASVTWRDAAGLDFLLHAVAWGSTAVLAWRYLLAGPLRTSLLVGFGGGLVAWLGFASDPGFMWWGALQTCRALAAGWFAVAVWQTARGTRDAVA